MPTPHGTLPWRAPAPDDPLLAAPVRRPLAGLPSAVVTAIDPDLADTAAFCAAYDVDPAASANCVIVAGRRGDITRYAAVVVLATDRADVNGAVRRRLDVRKISFAAREDAVGSTGMEFGGITPVGLPTGWPILIDQAVVDAGPVVIGSGLRASKLLVLGAELASRPDAEVLPLALPRPG